MADHRNIDAKIQNAGSSQQRSAAKQRFAPTIVPNTELELDDSVLSNLYAAAMNSDPAVCRGAVENALADGISPEDLADAYIPTIARQMGEQWCVDQISFATVTIGTSRLQAMLRLLGPNWTGRSEEQHDAPAILLVVLQEIYHTLGAIVLSGQLRRKGVTVKLVLGCKPREVAERISRTNYEAVFISSSMGETLESLRQVVDAVRASTDTPPPIVIGGTILDVETVEDVMALTGADYATQNPDEALRLCGFNKKTYQKHRA